MYTYICICIYMYICINARYKKGILLEDVKKEPHFFFFFSRMEGKTATVVYRTILWSSDAN